MKKKILSLLMALAVFGSFTVFAEDEPCVNLEFKDFLSENSSDFQEKDNGFVRINKTGITSADYTVSFTIPEKGDYSAEIIAAAYTENSTSLSKVYVRFDEDEPLDLLKDFKASEHSASGTTYIRHRFNSKNEILLSEGEHTMTVSADTMDGGRFRYELQSLIIKKFTEPIPDGVIVEGDTRIEVEDVLTQNIINDGGASGGKALVYFGSSVEPVIEIPFFVMKPGEYNLNIAGACNVTNTYISPINYIVDDDEMQTISADYKSIEQAPMVGTNYVKNFPMALFRCPQKYNFDKGYHKITFKVPHRSGYDTTYVCIDYIELSTDKDITNLDVSVEGGYVEIGKDAVLHVFEKGGDEITEATIFGQFLFESSGAFANIKDKKLLFGERFGKEKVSVEMDYNAKTYTANAEIYVTDKNGLVITGAKRDGDTVNISIAPQKNYSENEDYLLIYVYENTNGVLHSIKNIYRIDLKNLSSGETHILSQQIDADTDDVINVLLFNKGNEKASAYQQITVE